MRQNVIHRNKIDAADWLEATLVAGHRSWLEFAIGYKKCLAGSRCYSLGLLQPGFCMRRHVIFDEDVINSQIGWESQYVSLFQCPGIFKDR